MLADHKQDIQANKTNQTEQKKELNDRIGELSSKLDKIIGSADDNARKIADLNKKLGAANKPREDQTALNDNLSKQHYAFPEGEASKDLKESKLPPTNQSGPKEKESSKKSSTAEHPIENKVEEIKSNPEINHQYPDQPKATDSVPNITKEQLNNSQPTSSKNNQSPDQSVQQNLNASADNQKKKPISEVSKEQPSNELLNSNQNAKIEGSSVGNTNNYQPANNTQSNINNSAANDTLVSSNSDKNLSNIQTNSLDQNNRSKCKSKSSNALYNNSNCETYTINDKKNTLNMNIYNTELSGAMTADKITEALDRLAEVVKAPTKIVINNDISLESENTDDKYRELVDLKERQISQLKELLEHKQTKPVEKETQIIQSNFK